MGRGGSDRVSGGGVGVVGWVVVGWVVMVWGGGGW